MTGERRNDRGETEGVTGDWAPTHGQEARPTGPSVCRQEGWWKEPIPRAGGWGQGHSSYH